MKESVFVPLRLICFFLLLISCSNRYPQLTPVIFSDTVMTINYRILVGEKLTHEQRIKIQQIIRHTFTEIDATYNKWNPQSEISQLNQLLAGEIRTLSPQLFEFFTRIDYFVKLSEGRFDPTVEPLQELWKTRLEQGFEPSLQEIEHLKPAIGWEKIMFTDGQFQKLDDRTKFDFGGIAKGYCVDLLVERLNQAGFINLFVEWGGEIRTSGYHPEGRPWAVYITKFGNSDPNQAITQLDLVNQAIATSGDYYQNWKINLAEGETKTYCHIFNPLSLSPLEVKPGSVASASLVADDCLTADTLAKVLMLFETVEEAHAWIKTLQETYPNMACWIVTR